MKNWNDELPDDFRMETEPLSKGEIAILTCLNEIDRVVHECAQFWPDEYLDARDGKQWRVVGTCGPIRARYTELNDADREWLENQVVGAIVDVSNSNEKPMYFTEADDLHSAKEALEASYGMEFQPYIGFGLR
jgi:hypothetical protein